MAPGDVGRGESTDPGCVVMLVWVGRSRRVLCDDGSCWKTKVLVNVFRHDSAGG